MKYNVLSTAVVALLVTTAYGLNVDLTVYPETQILPGLTKSLLVNCSVRPGDQSVVDTVTTLVLYQAEQVGGPRTVIASLPFTGKDNVQVGNVTGDVKFTGHLKATDKYGYIAMQVTYPDQNVAGEYTCEVGGLDKNNKQSTFVENANVSVATSPSVNDLVNVLKEHDQELTNIRKEAALRLQVLRNFETSLFSFSLRSPNGSIYLLSKPFFRNVFVAQSICALVGGSLAEIQDEGEHQFIISFLKYEDSNLPTMIGLRFYDSYYRWMSNDIVADYTAFVSQANVQQTDTCVALSAQNYQMERVPCADGISGYNFLCEVQE